MPFVVLEFTGDGFEEVSENFGVLSVVVHPVIEDCVSCGNETSDDVGDGENRSVEFFGFSCIRLKISATMCVFPGMWWMDKSNY